ncbi:hypothetical protein ACQBAR_00040 [Propionibacteriaceae bacterium Y1685]|uniref:hypothetical protein n=1 Tax=Microlunatus sp. Y1700 TaxID=3418487 RepID=UPI003B7A1B5E
MSRRRVTLRRGLSGLVCVVLVLISAVVFHATQPRDDWGDHHTLTVGEPVPFDDHGATMRLLGHQWAAQASDGGDGRASTPGLFLMIEVVIIADRSQALSPEVTLTAGGDTYTPTRMNSAIVPPGYEGTVQILFDLPPAALDEELHVDFRPGWNVWLYENRPQLTLRLTDDERASAARQLIVPDNALQPRAVK